MTRAAYAVLAALLVVAGVAFRLGPWHLPLAVHHYGGGVLWGAMIFALTAALRPSRWGWYAMIAAASGIAAAVEATRLYHTPALDIFRATLAGQLLLGRIFSTWNILAYEIGILMTAALVRAVVSKRKAREVGL